MGKEIRQRHHMKAMIITVIFLAVAIGFIMMLRGQAERQPIPTERAVADIKSTDWKKYGTDEDGDHFYRFDESSKAFPDVLSVKTKIIYSESGKKNYIEKRQKKNLPVQGFEGLYSRTVLYGLNCVSEKGELVILEVFELTKDGKTLDYAKTGSYKNWTHIPPDSVYAELHRVICPEKER
ncbi:MAG: hypothetical protein PHT96_07855 [Syntrophorhabdaceae bacterium]|nr:hypothetical protein [Syntrophorhabdaceae bacterium]MDD4196308.1 hypothetical protein [Syntrophorhabdaceae bacterium]HOC45515.1 hypothetical protein [Syntrophorhabdaceae bacterium]